MISGSKVFLACLLLLPVAAQAQTDPALVAVMARLASVKQSQAHFTEQKYLASLTEPLESEGTLIYVAPEHIEKITTTPEPESLIVTGDELNITHGGDVHTLALSDHPELQAFVESIRATLSGDLPTLQQYYTVGFSGTTEKWQLLLQPTDTAVQQMLTSIRLEGAGNSLTRAETISANGDRSDMTITP